MQASLTANGIELDQDPGKLGELADSTPLLGDTSALREQMEIEGYLYLPGFIDPETVLDARREILLKYAIIGEIDPTRPIMDAIHSADPCVRQANIRAFSESVRSGLAYEKVVTDPKLLELQGILLGGPIHVFDFRWPRFVRPGEGCGFHCDGPYMMRATKRIHSCWIPLGNISRQEGALLLLERSHRHEGLLRTYGQKDADRDKLQWLGTDPLRLQDKLGGRWLTTDFRAGDVLCFGMNVVHGALDNRSPDKRCRLSSDTRYQLASEPKDERWNGSTPSAHGPDKVFYPGLGHWNNADFQDEWKRVDERGRLLLSDE